MGLKAVASTSLASATLSDPTITGIPVGVAKMVGMSGVPVYLAGTGSIADNGALTLTTTLARTHSNGLYLYFPEDAIAVGVAAGFYWTVMSSGTAGTIYNSTYSSGFPSRGTATAFATTGPGAYTGVTGAITAQSVTLPANSMGARGGVMIEALAAYTNSSNAKTIATVFGGTTLDSSGATTTVSNRRCALVFNTGATNAQIGGADVITGVYGPINDQPVTASVDTTAAVTIAISLNKADAGDNFGCEYLYVQSMFQT